MNEDELSETLKTMADQAPAWADLPMRATMIHRRRTRRRRTVTGAAAAAVLLTGAGAWHWSTSGPSEVPAGPVPGPTTSLTDTALTYLHAATTGDCAMTKALTAPRPADVRAFAWCTDPTMLNFRDVSKPTGIPASEAGANAEVINFTMTTTESSDHSLSAGTQPWGLEFIRTPAGWRVYDQGTG